MNYPTLTKEDHTFLLRVTQQRVKQAHYNRKKYCGITQREYEELFMLQHGLCAICNTPLRRPNVDHNHKTKKPRGLLCTGCNIKMAAVDDPGWLHAAILYLIRAGDELSDHWLLQSRK
jgi:Recombination endonuclease VII